MLNNYICSDSGNYDYFINKEKSKSLEEERNKTRKILTQRFKYVEDMLKNSNNTELIYSLLWNSGSDSCSKIIRYCEINGIVQNCSKLFQILPTSNGACCTFNAEPNMYRDGPFAKVREIYREFFYNLDN